MRCLYKHTFFYACSYSFLKPPFQTMKIPADDCRNSSKFLLSLLRSGDHSNSNIFGGHKLWNNFSCVDSELTTPYSSTLLIPLTRTALSVELTQLAAMFDGIFHILECSPFLCFSQGTFVLDFFFFFCKLNWCFIIPFKNVFVFLHSLGFYFPFVSCVKKKPQNIFLEKVFMRGYQKGCRLSL